MGYLWGFGGLVADCLWVAATQIGVFLVKVDLVLGK